MMKIEKDWPDPGLDRLISECFCGGELRLRELRLTPEQACRLAADYPALVEPVGEDWYQISFQEALYSYGG